MSIAVMDTSISDSNLGNQIIMKSIYKHLYNVFSNQFIYKLPYMEISTHTLKIIEKADICFFGGTNSLTAKMEEYSQWGINKKNYKYFRNFILLGVGWWQYQDKISNYTKKIMQNILSNDFLHAVRDTYSENMLKTIGIKNIINTGCPAIWELTNFHIEKKSNNVIFTITDYNMNKKRDKKMISILKQKYNHIYCWPQGENDLKYLKDFENLDNINIIPPYLAEYENVLINHDVDYIGTRLHAGIRALQSKKRVFILGIDNRSIEMFDDFNIPVINENEIDTLETLIDKPFHTDLKIPKDNIQKWKRQFMLRGYE